MWTSRTPAWLGCDPGRDLGASWTWSRSILDVIGILECDPSVLFSLPRTLRLIFVLSWRFKYVCQISDTILVFYASECILIKPILWCNSQGHSQRNFDGGVRPEPYIHTEETNSQLCETLSKFWKVYAHSLKGQASWLSDSRFKVCKIVCRRAVIIHCD